MLSWTGTFRCKHNEKNYLDADSAPIGAHSLLVTSQLLAQGRHLHFSGRLRHGSQLNQYAKHGEMEERNLLLKAKTK